VFLRLHWEGEVAFERVYGGLRNEFADELVRLFTSDGAVVRREEDEGATRLTIVWSDVESTRPADASGNVVASVPSVTMPVSVSQPEGATPWTRLVQGLRNYSDLSLQLKIACLSQWILESGRGTSVLAKKHLNFGGLKYRTRMQEYATAVDYVASDGEGVYCSFASEEAFVRGYWHFIASGPYDGWEAYREDGAGYLRHIAPKYASDPDYVRKVLDLFEEARRYLAQLGEEALPIGVQVGPRLAVVVGHNASAKGASATSPIGRSEFEFNNVVADRMLLEAAHYNLTTRKFNRTRHSSYADEIRSVYDEVADWKADCVLELHFNALDARATGTEMLFLDGAKGGRSLAANLVSEVGELLRLKVRHGDGLVPLSRGMRGYSSVAALSVPTVLCEPFFGSNPSDCTAAAVAGEDGLARAYLRAVRDWA
jgi:hypothetical protein